MRRPIRSSPGVTLMEMLVFSAIGIAILITMIGFLTQGSRILEIGRQSSGAGIAVRVLLETLGEDAAELVSLENGGASYDSQGGGTFSFIIRSSRNEGGLGSPGLRRVEYKLEGGGTMKDCVRTITAVGGGGGSDSRRLAIASITRLRIWPLALVKGSGAGPRYQITPADAAGAGNPGSSVACLLVDVSAGQAAGAGDDGMEAQPVTGIVTKLWCRNRILELSRGALQ